MQAEPFYCATSNSLDHQCLVTTAENSTAKLTSWYEQLPEALSLRQDVEISILDLQ